MTVIIWSGAQSGVDRGSGIAALRAGFPIGGFMPRDEKDEYGEIPVTLEIDGRPYAYRRHFKKPTHPGTAIRTRLNVETCAALLVIVEDAQKPWATPGTKLTLDERRIANPHKPYMVVDPTFDRDRVARWAVDLDIARGKKGMAETRLMVAGPRASKWADGEQVAADFVRVILELARG
jgi:hypothetical protein